MLLINSLLNSKSLASQKLITTYLLNNIKEFESHFNTIFNSNNYKLIYKFSWCCALISDANKDFFNQKQIQVFILCCKDSKQKPGAKRNILHALNIIKIQEDLLAECFNLASYLVYKQNEEIAIVSFSLKLMFQISKKYPELLPEVLLAVDLVDSNDNSLGVKSVINRIKSYKVR